MDFYRSRRLIPVAHTFTTYMFSLSRDCSYTVCTICTRISVKKKYTPNTRNFICLWFFRFPGIVCRFVDCFYFRFIYSITYMPYFFSFFFGLFSLYIFVSYFNWIVYLESRKAIITVASRHNTCFLHHHPLNCVKKKRRRIRGRDRKIHAKSRKEKYNETIRQRNGKKRKQCK